MDIKQNIDIILICKGWYQKKYNSILEAFNAYYHKYYGCENVKMDKKFALNLFLIDAYTYVDEKTNHKVSFAERIFNNKYHPFSRQHFGEQTVFEEELYDRIVTFFATFDFTDEMDLSEYEDMFIKNIEDDYEDSENYGII